MTDKKCPKCGSRNFGITAKVTAYMLYTVIDGHVYPNGADYDDSDTLSETCICDQCGHRWHPKNHEYTIDREDN